MITCDKPQARQTRPLVPSADHDQEDVERKTTDGDAAHTEQQHSEKRIGGELLGHLRDELKNYFHDHPHVCLKHLWTSWQHGYYLSTIALFYASICKYIMYTAVV